MLAVNFFNYKKISLQYKPESMRKICKIEREIVSLKKTMIVLVQQIMECMVIINSITYLTFPPEIQFFFITFALTEIKTQLPKYFSGTSKNSIRL